MFLAPQGASYLGGGGGGRGGGGGVAGWAVWDMLPPFMYPLLLYMISFRVVIKG